MHLSESRDEMGSQSALYLYATEMVSTYYDLLGVRNRTVLTVCGSGDQVLGALWHGAISVCGFDVDSRAAYVADLKRGALLALDYEEYLAFFSFGSEAWSRGIYDRIAEAVSPETKNFFDQFIRGQGAETGLVRTLFRDRAADIEDRRGTINHFLKSKGAYQKMRQLVTSSGPPFLHCGLDELRSTEKLNGHSFDLINLSNIPNYLTGPSFAHNLDDVFRILAGLKSLLSPGGCIFFYSFNSSFYPNEVASCEPPASSPRFAARLLESEEFTVSTIEFDGLRSGHDRITVLRGPE